MNDDPIDVPRDPSWASTCQNCGAPLAGRFCAQCGQRAIPPKPTINELAGDAWNELVGWDGKFLKTLRTLIGQPGELTRAAVEGRRARYISPVRLYLLCSVVYFLAAAAVPLPDAEVAVGPGVRSSAPSDPTRAAFDKAIRQGFASLNADELATIEAEIARQPAMFRPVLRRYVEDYAGVQRRIDETLPRALFVLVPVLALVLAVFYRGRHYPEHLYTALHLQTFVFIALTLQSFVEYTRSLPAAVTANVIAMIAVVAYAIVAQRRIYGDSLTKVIVKALGVAAAYGLLWAGTSFAVAVFAASS